MNERLKEIAVKAQVEHCISHVRLKEFAELIVRDIHAYVDARDTAQILSRGILNMYGLQECVEVKE